MLEKTLSNVQRLRENRILFEILAARETKRDLSSFLHKAVQIISEELYSRGCSIFTVDPIDKLIRLRASLGVVPGKKLTGSYKNFTKRDVYYHIGEGRTGTVFQDNKLMIMNHVDIEPSKWLEKEMSNTFLLMPIPSIVEDKAIGVIRCATKPNRLLGSTIEAFNHEDLDILSYIAKLISVFIEVSIFHENQKQLLTKMPHEIRASLGNIMYC